MNNLNSVLSNAEINKLSKKKVLAIIMQRRENVEHPVDADGDSLDHGALEYISELNGTIEAIKKGTPVTEALDWIGFCIKEKDL